MIVLQPGTPVRMQILDEIRSDCPAAPRPVEPVGSVAVLRSVDQVAFVVHLSQWSGSLGPLEMKFAERYRVSDRTFGTRRWPTVATDPRSK